MIASCTRAACHTMTDLPDGPMACPAATGLDSLHRGAHLLLGGLHGRGPDREAPAALRYLLGERGARLVDGGIDALRGWLT